MTRPKVDEVLEFLNDWRTNRDIQNKFNFSHNEWKNYRNWLKKAKLIRQSNVPIPGNTNTAYLYMRDDNKEV